MSHDPGARRRNLLTGEQLRFVRRLYSKRPPSFVERFDIYYRERGARAAKGGHPPADMSLPTLRHDWTYAGLEPSDRAGEFVRAEYEALLSASETDLTPVEGSRAFLAVPERPFGLPVPIVRGPEAGSIEHARTTLEAPRVSTDPLGTLNDFALMLESRQGGGTALTPEQVETMLGGVAIRIEAGWEHTYEGAEREALLARLFAPAEIVTLGLPDENCRDPTPTSGDAMIPPPSSHATPQPPWVDVTPVDLKAEFAKQERLWAEGRGPEAVDRIEALLKLHFESLRLVRNPALRDIRADMRAIVNDLRTMCRERGVTFKATRCGACGALFPRPSGGTFLCGRACDKAKERTVPKRKTSRR